MFWYDAHQVPDKRAGEYAARYRSTYVWVFGFAAAGADLRGPADGRMADVAPPNMPPGSNIGPESQTQVQMRAERVLIAVTERGLPDHLHPEIPGPQEAQYHHGLCLRS